jgi:F-type H+-transporting ATPase subunit delta
MMYSLVIARRYARALLLSLRGENLDAVGEQLGALADLYEAGPKDFARLFIDPSFSPIDRRAVINQIAKHYHLNEMLHKFLLLLVNKDRMLLLPVISGAFLEMTDAYLGRLRVKIMSASPVEEGDIDAIKNCLKKASHKEILAETTIDDGLLAGIRVEASGAVFDGTLKAKLSAIESSLLRDIGQ